MVRVIILQQCHNCVARVIAVASASGRVVGDVMLRVIILQQCHNCVASHSSSQCRWRCCCSSRGATSSDHLVVALSYSKSNISSQREGRCCWDSNLIIH